MMMKIYLATPYTCSSKSKWANKFVQWWRYRCVTKLTALWVTRGYNVFSPITHSHPLPKYIPDRLNTHSLWLGLDFAWIDCCDELWVYMQSGWKESHGVQKEIAHALSKGMPVRYITEENVYNTLADCK